MQTNNNDTKIIDKLSVITSEIMTNSPIGPKQKVVYTKSLKCTINLSAYINMLISLLQPPAPAADRNSSPEQPDGAVVSDALPHAPRLPVPPRVQGMVLQPADGNDRGQPGVQ